MHRPPRGWQFAMLDLEQARALLFRRFNHGT
jgi:hypothetical protein